MHSSEIFSSPLTTFKYAFSIPSTSKTTSPPPRSRRNQSHFIPKSTYQEGYIPSPLFTSQPLSTQFSQRVRHTTLPSLGENIPFLGFVQLKRRQVLQLIYLDWTERDTFLKIGPFGGPKKFLVERDSSGPPRNISSFGGYC